MQHAMLAYYHIAHMWCNTTPVRLADRSLAPIAIFAVWSFPKSKWLSQADRYTFAPPPRV